MTRKDKKDKQNKVNEIAYYIAGNIFYNKGDYKFKDAYEKIKSRVYLDWDIDINQRLKNRNKKSSMFDVLDDYELEMTLQSCYNLLDMYKDTIENKISWEGGVM